MKPMNLHSTIQIDHGWPSAAEPQPNPTLQILQKATKGTKDQGGNHGSLLPLLPFVRNPVFKRLDLKTGKEPQMHTDSHGYDIETGARRVA